jgi:hypothetical protein
MGAKMKNIGQMLQANHPTVCNRDRSVIEVLIRRGKTTVLYPSQLVQEMRCQDCGGQDGYTCWDYGKRAWFCANDKCLETDVAITKAACEENWWINFHKQLKLAKEKKMKNKRWDGK